ncbi:MAG: hypothetical protein EAZ07_03500 [Cytophagales bacterium]|nr:MAG: hypothetical protein EAZ07_03500 [Cytophagales bacterium]
MLKFKKLNLVFAILLLSFSVIAQKKLQLGSTAPDFSGFNQKGKTINLYSELKDGPVVLLFYRGNWSEDCMNFLIKVQDSLDEIGQKQASVIAVTPEGLKGMEKTISKTKAKFKLVTDHDAEIMKLYDVEHKADHHFINQLKIKGTDLKELNETNGTYLPVPALFVIGKNKKINYVFFEADYSKRPNISDFIDLIQTSMSSGFKKK